MKYSTKQKKLYDIIFIVLSALLTGILWRLRGDHGWGSFKGMALVGAGLFLLICSFYPMRKKMNFELFPTAIFLTAITNEGWGTLNGQITGTLISSVNDASVNISPVSGIVVMLLLGFGWMPFFAAVLGYYLSDKKWDLKRSVIMIAVYYAIVYLSKATISHVIAKAAAPEAVSAFSQGLINAGMDSSPFKAYLEHFNNISWAKKLEYGRNYFQTVEVISQALGSAAVCIYIRTVLKDKKGALVQFFTCLSCAGAITIADIFIFLNGGGFRSSYTPPEWLSGWSNWEYFTGFLTGLFVALIVVICSKSDRTELNSLSPARITPDIKPLRFIVNYGLIFVFPILTTLVIPLALRITYENDFFFSAVNFKNDDMVMILFGIVAAAALIYPAVRFTKAENKINEATFFKAAPSMLFGLTGFSLIEYFCFGNAYFLNGIKTDTALIMYISSVLFMTIFLITNKHRQYDLL